MKKEFEGAVLQAQRLLADSMKEYIKENGTTELCRREWLQGEVADEYEHQIFLRAYIKANQVMVDYEYTYRGETETYTDMFLDMNLDEQYAVISRM